MNEWEVFYYDQNKYTITNPKCILEYRMQLALASL